MAVLSRSALIVVHWAILNTQSTAVLMLLIDVGLAKVFVICCACPDETLPAGRTAELIKKNQSTQK
jgi:hypothetical protein